MVGLWPLLRCAYSTYNVPPYVLYTTYYIDCTDKQENDSEKNAEAKTI